MRPAYLQEKFIKMKTCIITLVSFLLAASGFSQDFKFEYAGRLTPAVKKERLHEVQYVNDISPELWSGLFFQSVEGQLLQLRRIMVFPQPADYVYPQENYQQILDVVGVEISATSNGKTLSAQNTSDKLTSEQKNILTTADLGTDIRIKIQFNYKNQSDDSFGSRSGIKEGVSTVTVVPDTEAEYPGGHKEITEYFTKNVIDKIAAPSTSQKIQNAIVRFTINEEGKIVDAKISRTSTDPYIDKLLLDATAKMPKWKPAENSKGIKVKQEFVIPFGGGGC